MNLLNAFARRIFPWGIRRGLKSLFYFGFRLKCPLCGGRFRKMLTFGLKPRLNAMCPCCFSLERHRLLWLYLREKTDFFSRPLKVLHFAPEAALNRILKTLPNLDYVSADLESKLAARKMDITRILDPEDTYDVILCSHVLEHIVDDRKAMRELFRVLKPGGWAILQVPMREGKTFEDSRVVSPEDRERLFGQRDHVRFYGEDYKDRLEESGFTVQVDPYAGTLGAKTAREYGLHPHENIYLCTKPA